MKVSVLMPSRNRIELAKKSRDSLGSGDFELLVAIDSDDPQLDEYMKEFKSGIVMPRHGYQNLHEYYNRLAQVANGDWLMLWNDDATMDTKGWVDIIAKYDHTIPQVLNPWSELDNLFPLISRAWYEAVGHFAKNTHADSWVQQVANIDGRSVYVPGISIKHLGEEMNDPTHMEVRQIVRQTAEAYRRMGDERLEDARKISDYINNREKHNGAN